MNYLINIIWFIFGMVCYCFDRIYSFPFSTIYVLVSCLMIYLIYRYGKDN